MTEQIKPRKLKAGARIGVVNPAYWLEAERLQRAVEVFNDQGYELVLGKSTGLREHQCAGSPEQRAEDIMAMFEDSSIEAISLCTGRLRWEPGVAIAGLRSSFVQTPRYSSVTVISPAY